MLQAYRRQALDAAQNEYNEHVQLSIVANINLAGMRKEVDNDKVSDNAVDAIPMDESEEEVGPEPKGDGPPEDGPATPAAVTREHWITSARSSSGYKGVILEKKSGRYCIKHGGNTIARRNTLDEACSFYYNWCVARGLIKDFRLV